MCVHYIIVCVKLILHPSVRASTCCLRTNIGQIAWHTCDVFTLQTTRKALLKRIGMPIILCVHTAILDSQSACKGLERRKSVTLAITLRMSQV
jgi:hypothetical protein